MIKIGTLTLEANEACTAETIRLKHSIGIGGGSSVILIEGKSKLILVDTGFDYEQDSSDKNRKRSSDTLKRCLSESGVSPGDIDIIFVTHWHRDHFGNIDLFKGAKLLASRPVVDKFKPAGFEPVDNLTMIDEDVMAVYTPGHTEGHCSLIVKGDINTAIAGDAIVSRGYFHEGGLWDHNSDFFDEKTGQLSMKLLAEASHLIIPGHGMPFISYRPDWMENGLMIN